MGSSTSLTVPEPIYKVSHLSQVGLFYAILHRSDKLFGLKIFTAATVAFLSANLAASAPIPEIPEVNIEETPVEEVQMVTRWVLPNANANEARVLRALQDRGITDRAAIATVMGNIKQESRFHTNICEGGARTGYWSCTSGGYGLIQWTTQGRYDGLGRHAYYVGHDPSSVDAQVSYIFTERQWKGIEPSLKRPGQSINYYMQKAYRWLGWGHHGRRTDFAWDYYHNLQQVQVPAK